MRFEDLEVWKRSVQLSVDIHRSVQEVRNYNFRDQITGASLSIPSNIAEGFERESKKEMARFLSIAKGSCGELRTRIYVGMQVGYVSQESGIAWITETRELSAMLVGLMRSLKKG